MEEARERSLLRKALSPSPACATPVELGGLADGSLASPAAARVKNHVSACPRCQTELTLLQDFESAVPTRDEQRAVKWISTRLERRFSGATAGPSPSQVPQRPAPRRSVFTALNVGGFAVAAATLAAAVTIGLREGRAPELAQPSPAANTVLRSAAITTLSPVGDLDGAPVELRWEPQAGAALYSVKVMEVDHVVLWSAETGDASVALPRALRSQIVPGKPFLWEVVAKDATGATVAWSGKQRFRMKR